MYRVLIGSIMVVALVACGDATNGLPDGPPDAVGTGDGNSCSNRCSADLHQILDCEGNVVETCPDTQGCTPTGCVDACQAAQDNQSSIGCDYYAVAPDIIEIGRGACFAAFIANTWSTPVTISASRGATQFDLADFARIPSGSGQNLTYAPLTGGILAPGQVAILFLSRFGGALNDCPAGVTPALTTEEASVTGTGRGNAFRIVTSAPVVAYDIFPYGGGQSAATSATLLLPTSVWDTNYVAIDAFRKSEVVAEAAPSMSFVGKEDNTIVTINPSAAIVGGVDVPAAPVGQPVTYTLQAGEILQFTQTDGLIGSVVSSDKPIGHWAGASCLSVDVTDTACDSAHQQVPPVKALGNRYSAVRYRNRFPLDPAEIVPWRLVGAVDGTVLSYKPSTPMGAPLALAAGEVAEFWSAGEFVVSSQDDAHPFYIAQYMTGCQRVAGSSGDCRGDPEFVNIVPNAQWLASYTFFTDPTYPETSLVLYRERKNGAFADVTLDCAGVVTGWADLDGAGGDVQFARLDMVTGDFVGVNGCNNGINHASSALPFGMVVWGWGTNAATTFASQAVSYAYPAGAGVKRINTVILKAR